MWWHYLLLLWCIQWLHLFWEDWTLCNVTPFALLCILQPLDKTLINEAGHPCRPQLTLHRQVDLLSSYIVPVAIPTSSTPLISISLDHYILRLFLCQFQVNTMLLLNLIMLNITEVLIMYHVVIRICSDLNCLLYMYICSVFLDCKIGCDWFTCIGHGIG